ncbi:hypothetical protein JD969_14295 [Planctomycetota bacterium]|nr:hypothetical protein JD969_14295 [Planctomycetota bacterium]
MSMIDRVVKKAQRRMLMQRLLDEMWLWLLVMCGVFVVLLVVHFVLRVDVHWWWFGLVGGVCLLIGLVKGWGRRPSKNEAAAEIDDRLSLNDTLSTSLYIKQTSEHPFYEKIEQDAVAIVNDIKWQKKFRLKLRWNWLWVPVCYGAVLMAGFYLANSRFDMFGVAAKKREVATAEAEKKNIQQDIQQIRTMMKQVEMPKKKRGESNLQALMKELGDIKRRDFGSSKQREKAISQIAELNQEIDREAFDRKGKLDWMKKTFSKIDPDVYGPADQFAKTMRSGDFAKAQDALKELSADVESGAMSENEKIALEKQFASIADQLNEVAQKQKQLEKQAQKEIDDELKKAGLDQKQREELKKQNYDQEQVNEMLKKEGMSQQKASQMAKQMQKQSKQAKRKQRQSKAADQFAKSMGKMSRSMQKDKSNQSDQNQSQQNQSQASKEQSQEPSQQASQFEKGSWSAQQQLKQMQQMQWEMQKMQQAQQKMQQAMEKMAQKNCKQCSGQGCSLCNGTGKQVEHKNGASGQGIQVTERVQGGQKLMNGTGEKHQATRQGGTKAGKGTGDFRGIGRTTTGSQSHMSKDIKDRQGRVITDWMEDGENYAGDMQVEVNTDVTQAVENAERAVTDDRVSRRHRATIKRYFNKLPEVTKSTAPAAPE